MVSYNQNNEQKKGVGVFAEAEAPDNTETTGQKAQDIFQFKAVLYPQRSLGKAGLITVFTIIALYSGLVGAYFYQQGAWPIPGIIGLEILLVIWLFISHYRSGHNFETICLTDKELIVHEHFYNNREQNAWVFEPSWTNIIIDKDQHERSRLKIVSHGEGVILGDFLTCEEKQELADALKQALHDWKRNLAKLQSADCYSDQTPVSLKL